MSYKTVQFDYIMFYYFVENENGTLVETPLDLSELFREVSKTDITNTCKLVNDEEHRFHICSLDSTSKIWEVQLLRQREENRPGISNSDGTYELITLADGQYIAESSTLLYDETKGLVLFQRNKFGYSYNSLLNYLKQFYPKHIGLFIKPIYKASQIDKITDGKVYRKVVLVSDGTMDCSSNNSSLTKILKSFEVYDGKYITIEISMGRLRKRSLNSKATAELIREAYNSQCTNHLLAKLSSSSDTQVETIDLLSDRESVSVSLDYSRAKPITHERLFKACKENYRLTE